MIRRIHTIARTKCRDGITVSTLYFRGLGQHGGDYETALVCQSGHVLDETFRYDSGLRAVTAHANFVREHGGATGWFR
jgi:hypothetical protein